jgi:hypothetical protein
MTTVLALCQLAWHPGIGWEEFGLNLRLPDFELRSQWGLSTILGMTRRRYYDE